MTVVSNHEPERLAFADLDLPETVRQGIESAGFVYCTPIQAETLPFSLAGRDIAGQAQTGTGKTAAFLIATFSNLLRNPRRHQGSGSCPRALMIAPTRELAMQIRDEAELLGKFTGLTIHAVYGGVDYNKQLERLKQGVDILIGTPGRLIDYYKQKVFTLRDTEILVVDEADRMFDMGFIDDLRFLVKRLPPPTERTSALYSATLSYRVLELAYEYMNDVHRVAIDEDQVTADRVEQLVYHVGVDQKMTVLLALMAREKPPRSLVFVNTRSGARHVAQRLERQGYRCGVLMGDLDQNKRISMLRAFKSNDLDILVATDVASRGLHIDAVTHVFNFDLPQDPEDYVHRIGRTARAGASGKALSLACEHYVYSLEAIEEYIGMSIPHCFPEPELLILPPAIERAEGGPMLNLHESPIPERGGRGRSRSGRGGSGGGRGSGGQKSGRSPRPERTAQKAEAPVAEAADSGGEGTGKPKRKRRRRRRGKGGAAGEAAQTAPAEGSEPS